MSGRFVRASSFRHVHGDAAKPEHCFLDVRAVTDGDGDHIAANGKFMAFSTTGGGGPLIVHPLNKPGRMPLNQPKILVHKAKVLDVEFYPFADNVIATASDDCTVKITSFGEEGVTENITEAAATLEGHEKKVTTVHFNPVAQNVLASVSADNTMKLWDVSTQSLVNSYDDFTDMIFHFNWNTTGDKIVATCRDKKIRLLDPRDQKTAISTEGFPGSKSSRAVFMDNRGKIGVVGFGKASERMYGLWDPRMFDTPVTTLELDKEAGVMIPYYDEDTSLLYVGSKGGANISYWEITDEDPYVHFLSDYRDTQSQKGFCFLPKRACDASKCEIASALRLLRDSVVPISFQVPRKSDTFQKDLYPDAYAGVPSLEAKEWFDGKNGEPKKVSMNPKEKEKALAALGGKGGMVIKSAADLAAELAAANARIAELEAEIASLKASA